MYADQKSVIILRYIQELSILETAQVLGRKESKVKTTQHRAIKQLKVYMKEKLRQEKASKLLIPNNLLNILENTFLSL
jgi:RNA polymerase sigma-70 factor, ECF subfamily